MARLVPMLLVLVVADAFKHHPKFPKFVAGESDAQSVNGKVSCSTNESLRNDYILKSKCGEPKDVFVELKLQGSFLEVTPRSVWVKRCVGLCDYDAPGSQCVPSETKIEHIPIRMYNVKTGKYTCSTYAMEVHLKCECCPSSQRNCSAPKVFNPRKCNCQCPNMEERRNCLKKRNSNMRWNRSKCACEPKRRVTW